MKPVFTKGTIYCLGIAALVISSSQASSQNLAIDNLTNSRQAADNLLSAKDITDAIPLLSEAITQEELEKMQQQFRKLNPKVLDLKRIERPESDDSAEVFGVPQEVTDPKRNAPFWSAGKLAFKKPDGKTYRCSAQYSGDLKVILTAAHCVYDAAKKEWYNNFSFLRAFNSGSSPQTVGWKCASIYDAFHTPFKNYAYDYAFILADENDEENALVMSFGTPGDKDLVAIGYPKNFGAGQKMFQVEGRWESTSGGVVTMKGNPMRHGNSGGAWFTKFKKGGGNSDNLVVSVNSHHIIGNEEDENGPLFTQDTERLFEHVRRGRCN